MPRSAGVCVELTALCALNLDTRPDRGPLRTPFRRCGSPVPPPEAAPLLRSDLSAPLGHVRVRQPADEAVEALAGRRSRAGAPRRWRAGGARPPRGPDVAPRRSRGRGEVVEQCLQPLAGGLRLAGLEVGERAVQPVAQGAPAVLGDPRVGRDRQGLARVVALGKPRAERLDERDDRRGVLDGRLRVRAADLDRAEARVQPRLPPQLVGGRGTRLPARPTRAAPRTPPRTGWPAARPGAGSPRRASGAPRPARCRRRRGTARCRRAPRSRRGGRAGR